MRVLNKLCQLEEGNMRRQIIFVLVPIFAQVLCTDHKSGFRIIEGKPVSLVKFPYMAQIVTKQKHHCGGSIVHEYFVLTAAHCMYRWRNLKQIDPKVVQVIVGAEYSRKGGKVHEIEEVIIPKAFSNTAKVQHHDVCLIHLQNPISFSKSIRPVLVADKPPAPGDLGWVVGFGRTDPMRALVSEQLMGVKLPVVSLNECRKILDDVGEDMICAGFKNASMDACTGDSGGPFVLNGVQVGIVSWGDGCGQVGLPGVYTNVALHKEWLDEEVKERMNLRRSRENSPVEKVTTLKKEETPEQ